MSTPNDTPTPSSGEPQMSAGLDSLAAFHANYLMGLSEHEGRMEEAQEKANNLVQQLHNMDSFEGASNPAAPTGAAPTGMGSVSGSDEIIAAAYELANDVNGLIPIATNGLRAFLNQIREELKSFNLSQADDSDPDTKFAKNVVRNIEKGMKIMEADAAELDKLKDMFKSIISR